MFGINKNGTKHKIGIIMPSFFPASRTTYDNTTSGLSATRVQGAIDELSKTIVRQSVTINTQSSGDGVYFGGIGWFPSQPTIERVANLGLGSVPTTDFGLFYNATYDSWLLTTTNSTHAGKTYFILFSL